MTSINEVKQDVNYVNRMEEIEHHILSNIEKRFHDILHRLDIIESKQYIENEDEIKESTTVTISTTKDHKVIHNYKKCTIKDILQEIENIRSMQLRMQIEQELAISKTVKEIENIRQEFIQQYQEFDFNILKSEMNLSLAQAVKSCYDNQNNMEQEIRGQLKDLQYHENEWKHTFETQISSRIDMIWSRLSIQTQDMKTGILNLKDFLFNQDHGVDSIQNQINKIQNQIEVLVKMSDKDRLYFQVQLEEIYKVKDSIQEINGEIKEFKDVNTNQYTDLIQTMEVYKQENKVLINRTNAGELELHTMREHVQKEIFNIQNKTMEQENIKEQQYIAILSHKQQIQDLAEKIDTISHIHTAKTLGDEQYKALIEDKLSTIQDNFSIFKDEQEQVLKNIQLYIEQNHEDHIEVQGTIQELGLTATSIQTTIDNIKQQIHEINTKQNQYIKEHYELQDQVQMGYNLTLKIKSNMNDISEQVELNQQKIKEIEHYFDTLQDTIKKEWKETQGVHEKLQTALDENKRSLAMAKYAFEDGLLRNNYAVQQLNTLVDSIAITETTTEMDEKLEKFTVACAELALKWETMYRKDTSMNDTSNQLPGVTSTMNGKDQLRSELAILLTKTIRFLGSGVAIDQHRYLLTAKQIGGTQEPGHKNLLLGEIPSSQILENFRMTKIAIFCTKTRACIDQLQPILNTNRIIREFRDLLMKKIAFVLDFGLTNLFPIAGKPKNPNAKQHSNSGTCVACDRPIENESQVQENQVSPIESNENRGESQPPRPKSGSAFLGTKSTSSKSSKSTDTKSSSSKPIDTTSRIKNRCGSATGIRPKNATTDIVIHHAPQTAEYIYRGGFRMPRVSLSTPNEYNPTPRDEIYPNDHSCLEDPGSCLEKIPLQGRFSAPLSRPQTAPSHRSQESRTPTHIIKGGPTTSTMNSPLNEERIE